MNENINQFNKYLSDLSDKINKESCDYEIVLKAYSTEVAEEPKHLSEILELTLPIKTEAINIKPSSIDDILNSIKAGVNYAEGINNISPYIGTADHQKEISEILTFFKAVTSNHKYVYKFDLDNKKNDFHIIFNPIMWGFSYIIGLPNSTIVLLGSGSD